jgi:hypothetical protein
LIIGPKRFNTAHVQERMSESDAKILELAGRIKLLEVEASDLAARNSLLQRVSELQRESSSAAAQGSSDGLADMQVRERPALCCTEKKRTLLES